MSPSYYPDGCDMAGSGIDGFDFEAVVSTWCRVCDRDLEDLKVLVVGDASGAEYETTCTFCGAPIRREFEPV